MKNCPALIIYIFQLNLFILVFSNVGLSQCYYKLPNGWWSKNKSTGLAELDNVINNENALLNQVFGISVDLYVGTESFNTSNAMFAPVCKLRNCQGEIWIGKNLILDLFNKSYGLERLKAVFAHEYAHALQSRLGFLSRGKFTELHADFLAGYYIGLKGVVSSEKLKAFCEEFYSRGDFDFFNPNHHGTPEERGCAFLEGYKIGVERNHNTYQAFLIGIDYVKLNYPCASFKVTKLYAYKPVKVYSRQRSYAAYSLLSSAIMAFVTPNDIYVSPAFSFFQPVNNSNGQLDLRPGFGAVIQLRKRSRVGAFEYGIGIFSHTLKGTSNTNYNLIRAGFNFNYVFNLAPNKLPEKFKLYLGPTIKLYNWGSSIGGIFGFNYQIFNKFHLDFRYELTNFTNQLSLGCFYNFSK